MPSQRQLRVGEHVRHVVALFLQRNNLLDPVLETALLSVTEVRMSADLKIATCYVVSNSGSDKQSVIAALNRHARFIRGEVSRELRQLRNVPELRFLLDTSFDNFARIEALLKSPEVARDLKKDDDNN